MIELASAAQHMKFNKIQVIPDVTPTHNHKCLVQNEWMHASFRNLSESLQKRL